MRTRHAESRLKLKIALGSTDTACSSSLVAAHVARMSTARTGAGAVVGGVNATLLPDTTALFVAAGMLAADGRHATNVQHHVPAHWVSL